MASVQETLYAVLAADATLTAIVADRIHPGQIPDDESPIPWLFYAVPESEPYDDLGDDDPAAKHQVEFHALADTYATAKAIIDALIAAIDRYRGGQVNRVFWAGTSEESTDDGYHHVCRFDVWAHRTTLVPIPGSNVVTVSGGLRPKHMTDAAAANDTIYFSTTANALVYKDSGGMVHALY